ncbi:MAG: dihydrofolate reductase [Prevotellaceae bacterium]|jgi:dihydrofolate reductase|nr:dihydrofolate reductase [Prevotellaceae bacterium]
MQKLIIVAAATNHIIGKDNRLLWRLSGDMQFFKAQTTGHAVIMGRKTFESMGRPLPHRLNIIITRDMSYAKENCLTAHSLDEAFRLAAEHGAEKAFVIGGGEIYRQAWHQADVLYLTRVAAALDGDTTVPSPDGDSYWTETGRTDYPADERNEYAYSIIRYQH